MQADSKAPKVSARDAFAGEPRIEIRSADPRWIGLTIAPEMELKRSVADFFRSQLDDLPADLCDKLAIAFEELLGNSIEHGSAQESRRGIEIGYIRTSRMLLFHVRDAGRGFSLDSVPHAAVNNPPEDPLKHTAYRSAMGLRPGGYGILLVKQIADELIYNEHGNAALMIKYLDQLPESAP
jgi:anti-sigma regulatory factor (Ser/Thr protein kinase)